MAGVETINKTLASSSLTLSSLFTGQKLQPTTIYVRLAGNGRATVHYLTATDTDLHRWKRISFLLPQTRATVHWKLIGTGRNLTATDTGYRLQPTPFRLSFLTATDTGHRLQPTPFRLSL
ncbi:hypothetical protein L2E82_01662 [Cichorium intybus]|uniref:Uncharacterized protein n=1 Tax=Cichorium intybus TaxID=13427 RepID=A0ACB9H0N8_CICIN|nr:hypothetical protein L2E82_01662 [Cichorium intybus]